YTLDAIKRAGRFSLSILAEDTNPAIISSFGFCSSCDNDKYADYGYDMTEGAPMVKGKFAGRLVLDALNFVDNETHVVVLARLVDTVKGEGTPMTYDYYHRVVKGKAPKNAPTYVAEEESKDDKAESAGNKKRYKCDICGFIAEVEGELPADYRCPLCRAPKEKFTAL
ncbi:MAG: flavin reductase, partial [Prevotellaceae bacterium]|nr:flavin reductase [Prevotellaceae bacterium]